jgi:hypothetical protein
MTKQDFINRKEQADRSGKRFSAVYIAAFLLFLIANVFFARRVPKQYSLIYGVVFFALLIANLFVTVWIERRRVDKFNLRCPNCQKPLTATLGQLAVATGNCGNCGSHLFDN